ncbi:hypothetical protein KC906_00605, partial [Candidatus Kaiserbacteria bacterium]|nr:hypothetical protein [Candidatus Kaiserbacteria bacterium]
LVEEVEAPSLPTPVPTSQSSSTVRRTGRSPIWFEVVYCEDLQLQVGNAVTFGVGGGTYATPEEAEAGYAGSSATIILDGQPQTVYQTGVQLWEGDSHGPGGYIKGSWSDWVATAGTHTVVGYWTHWGGSQVACTFTVSQ